MRLWFVLSVLSVVVAAGQSPHASPRFSRGDFHGRDAYFLENGKIRVAALRGAGHIAEMRFVSDDPKVAVNPMRVPHFQTIEPWQYDPAIHDAIYGGGTNRYLQSGYMGHLLNFPTFGGPSAHESERGLGNHGEALTREWKISSTGESDDAVTLTYAAHLPKTQYDVGRTLTLAAGESVLYVEEWVESLTAFDRPAMWVEHVTFGPPFVEPGKTTLDMSAVKGMVRRGGDATNSLAPGEVTWPRGRNSAGDATDLRIMQAKAGAGTYAGFLMDPDREHAWFTMYHPEYRALIGYVWKTADFPWIGDWQENGRNTQKPWGGQVQARGMEFGTTPFGGTMQNVVSKGAVFGVPNHVWIGAGERKTVRYVAFMLEIPEGFKGVADVRVESGRIRVVERGTSRRFELRSEREW